MRRRVSAPSCGTATWRSSSASAWPSIYPWCADRLHCCRCTGSATHWRAWCRNPYCGRRCRCGDRFSRCIPAGGIASASSMVWHRRCVWGLPIALIPAFPWEATVLIMPACVGIGNALVDVGLFTLIARLAPDAVLARVFGILESLISLAVGLGAVVASLLINLTGLRIALVAVGALCPILVVVAWRRLRRLDRYIGELDQRDHTAPRPTHAAAITATCHRTAGPRSGTSPRACRPGGISPG